MGKFEENCNKLAHVFEVNTLNQSLVKKFSDIKRGNGLGINIMDRVLITSNPAFLSLKTTSWFVHKIKTVFDQ